MTIRNSRTARTWLTTAIAAAALAVSVPTTHAASQALEMARQLNSAFVEVADTAAPSVVFISVEQKLTPTSSGAEDLPFFDMLPPEWQRRFERRGQQGQPVPRNSRGNGSGFVISEDGYILTNNHVVEDADKITVRMKDGREFKAEVRGTDPLSDLAVIKIEAKGLKALKLADSANAKVGEFVIAIGAPFGLDHTVTVGHISAKGRAVLPGGTYADQDFIQTDASINPGNSGGPLVNLYGEVVGINSMIRGMNTGIGFAIPSNIAKQVADSLIKDGKLTRSRIGVSIGSLRDNQEFKEFAAGLEDGVVISGVQRDGPAGKVLKPRDIVVAVDGKKVKTSRELQEQIYYKRPGDTVTLDVVRDGKNMKLKVKTEAIPEEQADTRISNRRAAPEAGSTSFGIRVEPISDDLAKKLDVEKGEGVAVTSVDPSSVAAQRGIRPGDVITEVNRKPVNTPKEFRDAMKDVDLKKGTYLNVIREGTTQFLNLKETEE